MLLPSRTAMMSLIAVPVALFAHFFVAPAVVAKDDSEQARSHAFSQNQAGEGLRSPRIAQRFEPLSPRRPAFVPTFAVPRQVLLIDLNPVLDFEVLGEWNQFSEPLDDPALLDVAPIEATSFDVMPVAPAAASAFEPAMRSVVLPPRAVRSASVDRGPSRLPRLEAAAPNASASSGASPFAEALAPRPAELSRSRASVSRGALLVQPKTQLQSQPPSQPQSQPPLQQWDAPFPSLGQPQLDRQLRRYLAYLDTVGQPDILIVGGQGAAQGVDPLTLQESLSDRGHEELKVFNWGLSNSSAQTVEWLMTELLTSQQLPKLVVWADTSVALNGGRQDLTFGKIQASPGHRFLARGLHPQLSEQEKGIAHKLGTILSNPISHTLPASLVALASSPLDGSSQIKVNAKPNLSKMHLNAAGAAAADVTRTDSAVIAQAAPILVDSRSRLLPILMPQKPLPVAPASSASHGLASSTAVQSEASGFRLVNWCRNASGPCPPQEGQSPSAFVQSAAPAWLRQIQAAEAAQKASQQAAQSSRLPASHSATIQARLNQTSVASPAAPGLMLPDWPQNPASKRFLQAMGFQSVDQRLEASQPGQPIPLRGDQDRDYRNFSLQGSQNRALHRLLQFGQKEGLAIAFVQLPLSQQYLDIERHRREQSFRTYLDVAAQVTPLSLVELPGEKLVWNDALFAQPHRLNRYGAAALSWQIGQALDGKLLRTLR